MHVPKPIVFMDVLLTVCFAGYISAQQQSAPPSSPAAQKVPHEVSPLPKDFRITDGDLKLALAVSREVTDAHYEQVQKLLADNHVSIPQFQRTVEAACFLSAERQLALAQ